jgi:hypothetical protein
MKTTENTEGATGSAAPPIAQENPYLQPVANEQGTRPTNGGNGSVEGDDEEAAALAELAAEEKKRKHRRHRRFALALIGALLVASVVIAAAIYRQRSTRVEYGRAGNQPRVLAPPPNAGSTAGRDNRTKQAIDQMQQLTGENRSAGNANVQATTGNGATNGANSNSTNTQADSSHPFVLADSSDASQSSSTSEKSSATVSVTQNDQPPPRSQRSSETSLYVGERPEERSQPVSRNPEPSSSTPAAKESNTETKIVVPPFGSMLPVRTIGGLYTLHSGALVRLELSRDIVGNGWSMMRGTILVGTTKGGEHDRAYVAIIGFIDRESGKFVKLGGDVLGGDGAAGLKGKSRQLDSRWTRVLSHLGNAALSVTTAALGGRSNGTVIISDGARSSLINPVSDELNGLIGAQSDRNSRAGFVEVVAGTPGYVMVTDLPATINGKEPNAEIDVKGLAALSDIDAVRPATGISEREFAELISTGSPEEIKAKLHRMSPEMRKIALAVLQP